MKTLLVFLNLLFLASLSAQKVERVHLTGTSFEMGQQWATKQAKSIQSLQLIFNGLAQMYLNSSKEKLHKPKKLS